MMWLLLLEKVDPKHIKLPTYFMDVVNQVDFRRLGLNVRKHSLQ